MDTYEHIRASTDGYGHLWAPGSFADTYEHVSVGSTTYQMPIDTQERPQPFLKCSKIPHDYLDKDES